MGTGGLRSRRHVQAAEAPRRAYLAATATTGRPREIMMAIDSPLVAREAQNRPKQLYRDCQTLPKSTLDGRVRRMLIRSEGRTCVAHIVRQARLRLQLSYRSFIGSPFRSRA
jgi:hypothetical protein